MSDQAALLRELADAVDKDRGHEKSLLTRTMREAADERERLRAALRAIASLAHDGSSEDARWMQELARGALGEADDE